MIIPSQVIAPLRRREGFWITTILSDKYLARKSNCHFSRTKAIGVNRAREAASFGVIAGMSGENDNGRSGWGAAAR
ncbi:MULTISPECIES: hypothetical protein [unclassified Caulobacter]|uniref:hypothetical protein n=1 Tax=unclassified Caulobacter TaxID=2648921 RepID=UPI0012DFA7DB|nr:hypothetical protein [Caulobacter sp. UNC358MFTsu5.1]